MYACTHETGRGFFAGACAAGKSTAGLLGLTPITLCRPSVFGGFHRSESSFTAAISWA
jgi:hypothetical protein